MVWKNCGNCAATLKLVTTRPPWHHHEMEAMARDDKITRIESFMQVLLLHLMKQALEHRTTKSLGRLYSQCLRPDSTSQQTLKGGLYLRIMSYMEAF